MTKSALPLGHKKFLPEQLIERAKSLDVVLTAQNGKLHVTGNRIGVELLTPELAACRTELVRLLTPAVGTTDTGPTAPTPRPIPWFHLDAGWRKAYAAWNDHRNTCPKCRSSERTAATAGTGIRCAEGQRLHAAYEAALDSSPT